MCILMFVSQRKRKVPGRLLMHWDRKLQCHMSMLGHWQEGSGGIRLRSGVIILRLKTLDGRIENMPVLMYVVIIRLLKRGLTGRLEMMVDTLRDTIQEMSV